MNKDQTAILELREKITARGFELHTRNKILRLIQERREDMACNRGQGWDSAAAWMASETHRLKAMVAADQRQIESYETTISAIQNKEAPSGD